MAIHASASAEASNALADAIMAQTEAITLLTAAITRLSVFPFEPSPPEPVHRPRHSVQYWYRMWHPTSRSKENEDGDIIAGNPDWRIESEDDIALHFAEFHSDKTSKKDTALISATHDPIRAIKAAYQAWEFESSDKRNSTQVFISVIQSTDSYSAKDLKDKVLAMPLCSRLSREARNRLNDQENAHLYDSEGLFVSRIAKEQIKVRVSLQDLFDRSLLDDILPELCQNHVYFGGRLGPSAIRNQISNRSSFEEGVRRFKMIYCVLAGTAPNVWERSPLIFAQKLMQGDPALEAHIKEGGHTILQNEIDKPRVRRVQRRFIEDSI
ncbi:hypothetical protein OPT61_g4605 [Boeremia exigua]|uniref:Uncharacterized protein n=1 Tax=Boeremia exigua TaxID=749465 RepID=A0ACC2IDJ4_9PLEO|nr:hypothetical protein OPT61_g4605 [Boeremia exigua]